ncbi:MAG TPA: HNH endonuclease signature motif containing protein [Candidatus Limnocylindrales bacterium]|nr:HNH endonuclease signature motif containing protein [Candidatus Limnocylindrales bacterium]
MCRAVEPQLPLDDAGLERIILQKTRRTSRLRFLRGRLAASMRSKRSWCVLGYSRIGDYSRERLGIAGRTLEDDARVAGALEHLPHLATAFVESRLSWTKVRLVSAVASATNELGWIGIAQHCDTRTLAARVRDHANAVRNPQAALQSADLPCVDPTGDPEDCPVRFSVRISRDGRRLWRATCEMAERSAGSSLTRAQVLELVVAEAASGAPLCGEVQPDACGMRPPRQPAAEASAGDQSSQPDDGGFEAQDLDPAEIAAFDCDAATDPFTLDARLRGIERAIQRIDCELGGLLVLALERRIHRAFGFTRFADYVEDRLDFCARKAWLLIAIERQAASHSGELASAYREGRLSYLAVSALLPVTGSRHDAAWIARAQAVTLRRLEDEVEWALDQRDASSGSESFEAPAPPPLDHDVRAERLSVLERERVQMRAHGEADSTARSVELTLRVPSEVASLAEQTMLALRRGGESRGSAFERMVAQALLEWMSAPKHRDPVFERDGWRCAVPGCRSRRNLHDHHVLFRSLGGGNAQGNRITVCASHHLHGLHAGRIRARGRAPLGIVWDMPLGKLFGDRYL